MKIPKMDSMRVDLSREKQIAPHQNIQVSAHSMTGEACAAAGIIKTPSEITRRAIDEAWSSRVVDLGLEERFSLGDFFTEHSWGRSIQENGKLVLPPESDIGGKSLAELGLRIERVSYPEGYGFVRIWRESLNEAPVLTIKYDVNQQAATKLSAWASALEVKSALLPLLDERTGTIRACFNILGLSEVIGPEQTAACLAIIIQRQGYETRLNKIKPVADISFSYEDDVDPGVLVTQNEWTVARHSNQCRTIRTGSIGPCVALILYDEETRSGAIFHIDSPGPGSENCRIVGPIGEAISIMESWGAQKGNIYAYLIGGNSPDSPETVLGILDTLPAEIRIKGQSILQMNDYENVAVDLGSGRLSRYNKQYDQGQDQNAALRLMQAEIGAYFQSEMRRV